MFGTEILDRKKTNSHNKTDLKFSYLWGICFGSYVVLVIYWIYSAVSLGSPLGKVGDAVFLLLILHLVFFLSAGVMSFLLSGLIRLCGKLARHSPVFTHLADILISGKQRPWANLWGLLVVITLFLFMPGEGYLWLVPLVFGMLSGLLISLAVQENGWQRFVFLGIFILLTGGMVYFTFFYGVDSYLVEEIPSFSTLPDLDVPDPGGTGETAFSTFTYGSGRDRRRSEYTRGAAFTTQSVDASMLWEGYSGFYGHIFSWYWGFSPHLPAPEWASLAAGRGRAFPFGAGCAW